MRKPTFLRVKLTEEARAMLAVMRLLRQGRQHQNVPEQVLATSMRVPALLAMRQPGERP